MIFGKYACFPNSVSINSIFNRHANQLKRDNLKQAVRFVKHKIPVLYLFKQATVRELIRAQFPYDN
jgi:hypothetical protein